MPEPAGLRRRTAAALTRRLPSAQPELDTARLRLRGLVAADASAVVTLASDAAVSEYLLHMPHPYPRAAADDWVREAIDDWPSGGSPTWAIARRREPTMMGVVWLRWTARHARAELGYWLGRRHWGHGYAREAAAAAITFAFDVLEAHRVHAQHLDGNDRSGALLRAVGMTFEGVRRGHVKRGAQFRDLHGYAIVRGDRA
ncbi:MAG: GNAT family N-acetyltransferase [Myxococcales bacterium]|nr:GNAT family N-acetyltransferase [Myxococcales bacterium]